MELTFKDTLMFYQTSLRNVGLYTSISLALLGSSRFHRNKGNKLFNISFILISMIILFRLWLKSSMEILLKILVMVLYLFSMGPYEQLIVLLSLQLL